jgi:hypothetical protein
MIPTIMKNTLKSSLIIFFLFALVPSCNDEGLNFSIEPAIGFAAPSNTLEHAAELDVDLYSNVSISESVTVEIGLTEVGVEYGVDYITSPEPVDGVITLTADADTGMPSFTMTSLGIAGNNVRKVYFEILSVNGANLAVSSVAANHVIDFAKVEQTLYSNMFDVCSVDPTGFTEAIVPGAMSASTWGCTTFGYPTDTPNAIEANAFGKGTGTSNAYLVLDQSFDGSEFNDMKVSFQVYSRFSGAGTVKILYSKNYSGSGNPEAAGVTWTEFPGTSGSFPAAGSRVWTAINGNLLNVGSETVRIAFQYQGGTTGSASNWRIDDLVVKAK